MHALQERLFPVHLRKVQEAVERRARGEGRDGVCFIAGLNVDMVLSVVLLRVSPFPNLAINAAGESAFPSVFISFSDSFELVA